jgi:hypothetical protein
MRRTTIMSRRDMTTGTVGAWFGVDVACSSSAIVRVIVSLRPKPSKEVKEELSVCAPTRPSSGASRPAVR